MHSKKIINNSLISMIYKITIMLLGFVSRKIFIVHLGEEILGLNSLYSNLLDFLNLADLGIGVAVQYQLYEPLVKKDYEKLSKIITAAKKMYNMIGCFIFFAGVVLSVFIPKLIKSTTFPLWYVQLSFIISLIGITLGYFFVHKRLFLQANEELGIVNIIDLSAKTVTVIISLITTVIFENYFLYLLINALYGLIANLIIHNIFKMRYPQVKSNQSDTYNETKELTSNLKNVVPMKFSNYVYNSTDNVIISKVLGLSKVALYSNYMTIINGIMGIEYLFGNIMTSSIGKIIKEVDNTETIFHYYLVFQYIQFIFTSFCTVSLAVLCNPFITWWIGEHFIAQKIVYILLIIDFYVHSMYQPAYVMFGAAGKFRDDKYITLISAILNIIISLIMVNCIGLAGVIVGTLVTDLYIWCVRSYQMVKIYFHQNLKKYMAKMAKYTILTIIGVMASIVIGDFVHTDMLILELFVKSIICVIIPNAVNLIFTHNCSELVESKHYLKQYFRKGSVS